MNRRTTSVWLALATALLLLAAVAGFAGAGDAAPQAAPGNQSPPTISGTPEEGKTLTANNGTWTGNPTGYTYSWRRCDADGGSCAAISGAVEKTYVLKQVDVGNTIRVRVTARNADGSTPATSVPTAVVRQAAAPPAAGCNANAPIPIASVSLPDRLLIDGQSISPSVVGRSTQSISVRFRVTCKGKPVQGALLYADVVPYNQFTAPAEQPTGADGFATLTLNRAAGYPASSRQELLVVFARARKSGESLLGGVSTRRLVSFPVDLRR